MSKVKYYFVLVYLIGSVLFFGYFLFKMGFAGILNYFLPYILTTAVWLFYIASFYLYLFRYKPEYKTLVSIALLMQSVQFVVSDFVFKNYFGPYVGFGFSNIPEFHLITRINSLDYLMANGIRGQRDEYMISLNLIGFLWFLLFTYWKEPEQKTDDTLV